MPEVENGGELSGWTQFFSTHRPYPLRIRQWVMKLHRNKQHKQVIACLQAALISGQSQPWMYEVLALSMEMENYPKEEVERVVVSMSDFGAVNFEMLYFSAEYLTRFNRKSAALRLFRQASQLAPENHRPYVWGLKLANDGGSNEDLAWAASGVLQQYWAEQYEKLHKEAEDAVQNRIRELQRIGDTDAIQQLTDSLNAARTRDLMIRIDWNGPADIDMSIEEPPGSVCSFETPLTYAGGIFHHDGIGPEQTNCFEEYVCPQAVSGTYRVQISNVFGKLVGNRVAITVRKHAGTAKEQRSVHTIELTGDSGNFTVELDGGRRETPLDLSALSEPAAPPELVSVPRRRPRGQLPMTPERAEVLADFVEEEFPQPGRGPVRRAGAIGFVPVIQVIPEGATLSANAVISADRRYVRISVAPFFNTITDVFTYSLQGGPIGPSFQPGQQNP